MNSLLPPSRQKRPVQYLALGVSVIAILVVIYIAIQAVLAPWTQSSTAAAAAESPPQPSQPSDLLPEPEPPEDFLPDGSSPSELDVLWRQLDKEVRQLDTDIQQEKAQQLAIRRAKVQAVLDRGQEVARGLSDTQAEADRWHQTLEALLTNEDGRRIAASRDQLEHFEALWAQEPPSRESIAALRRRLAEVLQPVEESLESNAPLAEQNKEVFALLDEIKTEAAPIRSSYRDYNTRLEAIVAGAKGVSAPANVSLTEAVKALRLERAAQTNAAVARTAEEQRQRDAAQMAEVERKRIEQEEKLRREQAEKQRLIALAKDPNTQKLFAPFLAKGHTHMMTFGMNGSRMDWFLGTFNGPSRTIQYSDMQSWRIFTDVRDFIRVATDPRNDRPTWPRPSTDAVWAEYQKRFELFKQLAPVWRELGMIDP